MNAMRYYSSTEKYYLEITENQITVYTSNDEIIMKVSTQIPTPPYLFFQSSGNNKEYLILCTTPEQFCIIDCWMGHSEDFLIKDKFIWKKIWQVDANTVCIKGSLEDQQIFRFYDFSRKGLTLLPVTALDGNLVPSSKYHSIDNISLKEIYSDPILKQDGIIEFTVYETRVFGLGLQNNTKDIREINMNISEYILQENLLDGWKVPYSLDKIYPYYNARFQYQRQKDKMVLVLFWERDSIYSYKDTSDFFDPLETINQDYEIVSSKILVNNRTKYLLYLYPVDFWKLIRNYFIVEWHETEEETFYQVRSFSYKNEFLNCVYTKNKNTILSMLKI